jgi:hypothetical protein
VKAFVVLATLALLWFVYARIRPTQKGNEQ